MLTVCRIHSEALQYRLPAGVCMGVAMAEYLHEGDLNMSVFLTAESAARGNSKQSNR